MQTIKVSTHWAADQAVTVCDFLDELTSAILTKYRDEIEQMYEEDREYQEEQMEKQKLKEPEDWFDDGIPF